MSDNSNIYLIGPMGSGKTAVGRQLAAELGLEFFDSDAEIERSTGVDIAYIFEKEGDAIYSGSTRTLGNTVKDVCKAIREEEDF